jgi:hypothetical protein
MTTVREAEGMADLGMWEDAWEALEALPPEERGEMNAQRVRIRCCPERGAWQVGWHVALVLSSGGRDDREAAALFLYRLAKKRLDDYDREGAMEAVRLAVEICPDYRVTFLGDPVIAGLL